MKRIISILPIACALLLAACNITPNGNGGNGSNGGNGGNGGNSQPAPSGDSITAEQASTLLAEAKLYVMGDSFSVPTKFSVSAKMENSTKRSPTGAAEVSKMEQYMEFDATAKCGYMGSLDFEEGEESEFHQWLWAAGDKYYRAYSESLTDFSQGEYEEMSLEEFDQFFAMCQEEMAPGKKDIADIIGELQGAMVSANAYSTPSATLPEGASITYTKNKVEEKYYSTGAGNLSAISDVDIDANYTVPMDVVVDSNGTSVAQTVTVNGRVAAKFNLDVRMDKYLPASENVDYTILSDSEGEYMEVGGKIIASYNWGTCNFKAPDLSKFPAPKAQD